MSCKEKRNIRDRKLREWYHSHGLCVKCREPLGKDRKDKMYCNMCKATCTEFTMIWRDKHPEWREKDKERAKLRYERLKAEHRCGSCGAKLPDDDVIHAHCDACREKQRFKWRKKQNGISEKQREINASRRARWETEHLCTRCGGQLPDEYEYKTCPKCREYFRKWGKGK